MNYQSILEIGKREKVITTDKLLTILKQLTAITHVYNMYFKKSKCN